MIPRSCNVQSKQAITCTSYTLVVNVYCQSVNITVTTLNQYKLLSTYKLLLATAINKKLSRMSMNHIYFSFYGP